ncbi:MAG: MFS transporter [Nitrososphaerales archaeon]
MNKKLSLIISAKALRVFVFGLVSVMIPVYIAILGGSPFLVGVTIAVVIGGNIFSNMLLTWYGNVVGRQRALIIFSLLMAASGMLLFASSYFPLILFACFIGNISTTGTEAGPFQSIETGVLPSIVGPVKVKRVFGYYNMIGYSASSIGALAAGIPYYFHYSIPIFHYLFLAYGIVGLALFAAYLRLDNIETKSARRAGLGDISPKARRDIIKLSTLNSLDALGGGFVSQSILAYWFYFVYHVNLGNLGLIFFVVNVITALSTLGASFIAEKLGNLRTMVYTHLLSNAFLLGIPLAGSLPGSLAFLFLRQSVSQMDVPTRQAMMAELFNDNERVTANAITNTFRSASSIIGAPISGLLIGLGLTSLPLFAGGSTKIAYDIATFFSYRKEVR